MARGAWWVHGVVRSQTETSLSLSFSCTRDGHGNPRQCSCLENPRDGGAWWAAVYGVAQSRTRLTQLSSSSSSKNFFGHNRVTDTFTFSSLLSVIDLTGDLRKFVEGGHSCQPAANLNGHTLVLFTLLCAC